MLRMNVKQKKSKNTEKTKDENAEKIEGERTVLKRA